MGERTASRRSDDAGHHGAGPRSDRGRRGFRGGQGRRRTPLRTDPAPRAAGPIGPWSAAPWPRPRRGTPRRAGRPARAGAAARAGPDHVHRGSGSVGLGPRRQPAHAGRGGRADDPRSGVHGGRHGALAAQRAWRAGGPEEDVVRRERGGAGPCPRAWRERGDLREHRRQPVRGHRLERLLRGRRRAAHAHAAERMPRRSDPRADPRVVRRGRGRRADRAAWQGSAGPSCSSGTTPGRSTSRSSCWPAPRRSSSSPRRATCSRCTAATTGTCRRPARSRRRA